MNPKIEAILNDFKTGSQRALSRLITLAENGDSSLYPAMTALFEKVGQSRVLGITGPPGAGKSTLIGAFIKEIRQRGQTVAVVAVDPMSPM